MAADAPAQLTVPTEAVLAATAAQRNSALDELAKAQVLIEQLAAENERLRGDTLDA